MTLVQTERVLVIPTELFHYLGYFQGFNSQVENYLGELLNETHISYRPRDEMEEDPSFKQLIPYVVFRYTASDGSQSVFQYTRGSGQGESRLHRKRSVGVGGHISTCDQREDSSETYAEGMRRELDEEVSIETTYREQIVGLINDDETPVGKVHLGVVHLFDVETPNVTPREDEILDAGFRPVSQLMRQLDQMESWSSISMNAIFGS